MSRLREPWDCPFCGVRVDEHMAVQIMARRLFEAHLDDHMAHRDPLPPVSLLTPSRRQVQTDTEMRLPA